MEIKIYVNNPLTKKESLDLFIKEFKKALKTEATSGEYKSEFLNFKWKTDNN